MCRWQQYLITQATARYSAAEVGEPSQQILPSCKASDLQSGSSRNLTVMSETYYYIVDWAKERKLESKTISIMGALFP